MKASHLRPLKRVADGPDLSEITKRYRKEAKENKNSQSISDHEADGIAAERLEEERVIANVIGLAVVISVHFSTGDRKLNDPLLLWLIPSQRVRGPSISISMKNILRKGRSSLNSVATRIRRTKKS